MPEIKRTLISFRNVHKNFGDRTVIKDVSFDIKQGEIFGLIGVSGAGKTTLLRCLIGFFKVDSGKILYDNMDISKNLGVIRKIFGFATQDNCFYQELTVRENMKYFGKMYKLSAEKIKSNTEKLLKLVHIWDSRDMIAKDLSGGMQRRLDLAISLIHNPKILILDEPTTGLDPMLRKYMWNLIKKINGLGITVIISSHLINEMEHLCTDVAIVKDGCIIVKGSPDQLKDLYSKNEEIHLETYPGRYEYIVKALRHQGINISYVRHEEHKVVLYVPKAEKTLHHILHILEYINEKLLDVDVNKPTLGEVFEAFESRK